jgi:hypothetical protein
MQKNIERERKDAYLEGTAQAENEHGETVRMEVEKLRVSLYHSNVTTYYMMTSG